MKIYDKAAWHIDGGEKAVDVVKRLSVVFEFLKDKGMLNNNGVETLEYAMDSSVSLNSSMVNVIGKKFLETYYDTVLKKNPKQIKKNLEDSYVLFNNQEENV